MSTESKKSVSKKQVVKKLPTPVKKLPKVIKDDEERFEKQKLARDTVKKTTKKKKVDPKILKRREYQREHYSRTKAKQKPYTGMGRPRVYDSDEEKKAAMKEKKATWYKKMVGDKYVCRCGKTVSRCRKDNHVLTFYHLKATKVNVRDLTKKQMREILLKKLGTLE